MLDSKGSDCVSDEEQAGEEVEAPVTTVTESQVEAIMEPVTTAVEPVSPETELAAEAPAAETEQAREQVLDAGHLVHVPSVKLCDYVTYHSHCHPDKQNTSPVHPAQSRHSEMSPGKTVSSYPITDYITDEAFSSRHQA